MTAELFVDTSAFYALMSPRDRLHESAVAFYKSTSSQRKVTTNLVLAETYTRTRYDAGFAAAQRFLDIVEESEATGRLEVLFSTRELERQARQLLRRFSDQDLSYVDAVSFAAIRAATPEIRDVFAFDSHFFLIGRHVRPGTKP